ncbi:MAG: Holliday junction branch migration protein RuvA [Oscillospiraceae bacterium]|nr:Holliday junction branch migration protein RuvA [Oscillospiraceae bacterium]
MIYSLRGKLIHKEQGLAVVECAGVGYGCRTTYETLSQIKVNTEVYLYTYMSVREDAVELFGFARQQELSCFKQLISVSGVGPKAALSILSDMTPERFAVTVVSSDHKALTKSKGIGPKMAQRIVLELKDKISKEQLSSAGGTELFAASAAETAGGNIGEAVSALIVLGYSQSEAAAVISKLDSTLPVEELIKQSLKQMAMKL